MLQQGQQPPRQRLANLHTELLTRKYINYAPAFDPNFPFLYLLQTISVVLLQSMQLPYDLPIIFIFIHHIHFLRTSSVFLTRNKSLTHTDTLFWNAKDIMSKKYGFINYLKVSNITGVKSTETNLQLMSKLHNISVWQAKSTWRRNGHYRKSKFRSVWNYPSWLATEEICSYTSQH
jgi:hypothetical protein